VPIHLADKTDRFQGDLGRHYKETIGKHEGYKYPHAHPGHWVQQAYLPDGVQSGWYQPSDQGYEAKVAERLARLKAQSKESVTGTRSQPKESDD
jgi:putative ATPase